MDPVGCAFLRSYLRDHEKEVVVGETTDPQTLDASKTHVSFASSEFNHVVRFNGIFVAVKYSDLLEL